MNELINELMNESYEGGLKSQASKRKKNAILLFAFSTFFISNEEDLLRSG